MRRIFCFRHDSSLSYSVTHFLHKKQLSDVTIKDVLKFKRALTMMDDSRPFGKDFGPAGTREENVASANTAFQRLLRLSDTNRHQELPFEVLALLTMDASGTQDLPKKNALRKLFRPKKNDKLSKFIFIQVCDSIYKRLRYFRASVGNASVIDNVRRGLLRNLVHLEIAYEQHYFSLNSGSRERPQWLLFLCFGTHAPFSAPVQPLASSCFHDVASSVHFVCLWPVNIQVR